MRAIGNGIGIPFRRNTGQGVIWPPDLKSALVCWYSPRKQKLTEYDVIEAYAEDFTNWNYVKARGVATISQHKFIITECILKGLSIVEDIREPYSNLTVRIIGITDNQEVLITDYVNGQHQIINTITEDGIYTIEDRHHFVGFGCNFVGTCNITIEQLPTSILKDLSGNGNHAYLYGGKGKLNSGMGVYNYVFDNGSNISKIEVSRNKYHVYVNQTAVNGNLKYKVINNPNIEGLVFEIIEKDIEGKVLSYNGAPVTNDIVDFKPRDNAYTIELRVRNDNIDTSVKKYLGVQLLPNAYPDQLCYDGKMYAVCYGFPILTDYTVMAERTWFEIGDNSCFASKRIEANKGAFAIEYRKLYAENFGSYTAITFVANKKEIIVQSKEKYNDKDLIAGNEIDTNQLLIGGISLNNNRLNEPYIGCHSDILLFNRTLTQEEIDWVKNKIFQDTNN